MYGTAVMPDIISALQASGQTIAPSIDIQHVDGHNIPLAPIVRGASDIAISFVDSFKRLMVFPLLKPCRLDYLLYVLIGMVIAIQ